MKRSIFFDFLAITKQIAMLRTTSIFIFSLLLLTSFSVSAQIKVEPVQILVNSNEKLVKTVLIKFSKFEMETKTIDNQNYFSISVPGFSVHSEPGNPLMPVWHKLIEVPFGYEITVEYKVLSSKEYKGVRPIPAQRIPDRNKSLDNLYDNFILNKSVYNGTNVFPENRISLGEQIFIGGKRVIPLTYFPFEYSPAENSINVNYQSEIIISFKKVKSEKAFNEAPEFFSPTISKLSENLTLSFSNESRSSEEKLAPRMLIITHDNFYESILPLAEWKNRQGIVTKVIKTSDLGDRRLPTDIQDKVKELVVKDSVSNYYDYLLLVGDVAYIPAFSGVYNALNDHSYSTINSNDFLPDIMVGRFSVNTVDECDIYVNKVINYERNLFGNDSTSWLKNATVAASNDKLDDKHGRHLYAEFKNHGFNKVDDLRASNYQFTNYNIANALNEGRSWMFYIGHGDETAWLTTGTFSKSTIENNLTYTNTLPAIVSVACLNADLDYKFGESFGERWMNIGENKGAIAFIGSTELTPFYYSDTLGKYALLGYLNGEAETFGEALVYGKLKMYEAFPNNNPNGQTLETMQHFMVLGDPTIKPFTDVPKTISTNVPAAVKSGMVSLNINVKVEDENKSNVLVCVSSIDFSIHQYAYTDENGNVNFYFEAKDTGILFVFATGKNLFTYEKVIKITGYNDIAEVGKIDMKFYPNPANDVLMISTDNNYNLHSVEVYNGLGQQVLYHEHLSGHSASLEVSMLDEGVYFATVTTTDGLIVRKKFVVAHQ